MKQQSYVSFRIGDKNSRLPYSLLCTKICLHVKLLHVSRKIQGATTQLLFQLRAGGEGAGLKESVERNWGAARTRSKFLRTFKLFSCCHSKCCSCCCFYFSETENKNGSVELVSVWFVLWGIGRRKRNISSQKKTFYLRQFVFPRKRNKREKRRKVAFFKS